MRPSNAPDSAIPIPPPGPAVSDAQATQIAGIRKVVDDMNRVAGGIWDKAKSDWLSEAAQDRNLGITIRPKPQQPMGSEVLVAGDTDSQSGIIWLWLEALPIGEPCPDLPPVHVVVMGEAKIGTQIQGTPYFSALAGDSTPNGKTVPGLSADGQSGLFQRIFGFGAGGTQGGGGWWLKVAMVLLCLSLALPVAHAQVNLKYTPEPMAVPTAQISNAHDLGRWVVEGCNDGVAPVTIASERISMAAGPIRLVDADDALLVLTSHTRRGFWGQVAHWGPIVGMGVAAGLGVGGITNAATTVAISGGSQLIPTLTQVAQGEVPSVTPLISQLKYPITLAPGACFTDHRFAAKMPKPEVVLGVIK